MRLVLALLALTLIQQDETDAILKEINRVNGTNLAFQGQAAARLKARGVKAAPVLVAWVAAKGHNKLALACTDLFSDIVDEGIAKLCAELLEDRDFYWRASAARGLAAQKSTGHLALLRKCMTDKIWGVRSAAIYGLEKLADKESIEPIRKALNDDIYDVRAQAAKSLHAFGDDSGLPVLVESLRSQVQWFDIDYGQLAREDSWKFLLQFTIKPPPVEKLVEDFRKAEKREPDEAELVVLRQKAKEMATEEASPGYRPWISVAEREAGLKKWEAWMEAKQPGWREKLPPKARVTPDTATYTFGFELRSCRTGDYFFRIDTEGNLVLGFFNLVKAPLTDAEKALFAKALEAVKKVDPKVPYGEGGCDLEKYYYLSDGKKFSTLLCFIHGRPRAMDLFIKTAEDLLKAKFGEGESLEFKQSTSIFREMD